MSVKKFYLYRIFIKKLTFAEINAQNSIRSGQNRRGSVVGGQGGSVNVSPHKNTDVSVFPKFKFSN